MRNATDGNNHRSNPIGTCDSRLSLIPQNDPLRVMWKSRTPSFGSRMNVGKFPSPNGKPCRPLFYCGVTWNGQRLTRVKRREFAREKVINQASQQEFWKPQSEANPHNRSDTNHLYL